MIALVALFVALGGSAYAMSSTAKAAPAKANVTATHTATLKAVRSQASPVTPSVEPAVFTG